MRRKPLHLRLLMFIVFNLLFPVLSGAQSYPLEKVNVSAGGGGQSYDGNVYLHDTIGEVFGSVQQNPAYEVDGGFWRMVDEIHIGPTSTVAITSFAAEYRKDRVVLSWSIGSAQGLIGFNVYRSQGQQDAFHRINDLVIAGDGRFEYLDESLEPGATYFYRLGAIDNDGESFSLIAQVEVPKGEFTLHQNYPNPFNPTTTISFYLPEASHAVLTIYNARGERVRELLNKTMSFGEHEVMWNGRNDQGSQVSTGVYFYRLQAGKKSITKKLTVLK